MKLTQEDIQKYGTEEEKMELLKEGVGGIVYVLVLVHGNYKGRPEEPNVLGVYTSRKGLDEGAEYFLRNYDVDEIGQVKGQDILGYYKVKMNALIDEPGIGITWYEHQG
jgi:hypothetical protein